jgi:hypothetical protein
MIQTRKMFCRMGCAINIKMAKTYVKILARNLVHHKFKYQEGLNEDTNVFMPIGTCQPGGLYFCERKDVELYLSYGPLIADVTIPEGAEVYEEQRKLKANKIILSNIREWKDALDIYEIARGISGPFSRCQYTREAVAYLWPITRLELAVYVHENIMPISKRHVHESIYEKFIASI